MPNIILYWQRILSAISVTLFICFKIWKRFIYFQLIFEFRLWVCSQMFGPTLYAPLVPGTNDMSSFKFNGVRDWSPYLGRCLSDCVWVWPAMFELRGVGHTLTECLHKTNMHKTKWCCFCLPFWCVYIQVCLYFEGQLSSLLVRKCYISMRVKNDNKSDKSRLDHNLMLRTGLCEGYI